MIKKCCITSKNKNITRRKLKRKTKNKRKSLKQIKRRRKIMRGGLQTTFVMDDVIEIPQNIQIPIYTLDKQRNFESLQNSIIFEIVNPVYDITARVIFSNAVMIDPSIRYYGLAVMSVGNPMDGVNVDVGDIIYFPMGSEAMFPDPIRPDPITFSDSDSDN
tara:strand:+ start:94 stop:576 length:483 start_codon:yes stop_codon:yes gene_type:complete